MIHERQIISVLTFKIYEANISEVILIEGYDKYSITVEQNHILYGCYKHKLHFSVLFTVYSSVFTNFTVVFEDFPVPPHCSIYWIIYVSDPGVIQTKWTGQ